MFSDYYGGIKLKSVTEIFLKNLKYLENCIAQIWIVHGSREKSKGEIIKYECENTIHNWMSVKT